MTSLRFLAFTAALSAPAALLAPTALAAQSAPLPFLTLDAAPIGRTVQVQQVPGVPYEEAPIMYWPAHTRAVLNTPGQTWKAQDPAEEPSAYAAVIPLDTLKSHYPASATLTRSEIDRVVAAAQGGPITRSSLNFGLPYLPLRNAHQAAAGSLARISNSDIQGFRYLTVYTQESGIRFARTAVRYTFQGVTRDGKYLVLLHAPYEVRSLPTAEQIEREDARYGGFLAPFPGTPGGVSQAAFQKATGRYLAALTTKLNAEGRTGRLASFDAVVKSIRVGQ